MSLWSKTAKNTDCSTGPVPRPFTRSLAPFTHFLAPDCSLRSRPPLRSLVRSLAHFGHSLARGKVNYKMAILSVFFSIFDHSAWGVFCRWVVISVGWITLEIGAPGQQVLKWQAMLFCHSMAKDLRQIKTNAEKKQVSQLSQLSSRCHSWNHEFLRNKFLWLSS